MVDMADKMMAHKLCMPLACSILLQVQQYSSTFHSLLSTDALQETDKLRQSVVNSQVLQCHSNSCWTSQFEFIIRCGKEVFQRARVKSLFKTSCGLVSLVRNFYFPHQQLRLTSRHKFKLTRHTGATHITFHQARRLLVTQRASTTRQGGRARAPGQITHFTLPLTTDDQSPSISAVSLAVLFPPSSQIFDNTAHATTPGTMNKDEERLSKVNRPSHPFEGKQN